MNSNAKVYSSPVCRIKDLDLEVNFLASNTEPIIDDGEEHGWD